MPFKVLLCPIVSRSRFVTFWRVPKRLYTRNPTRPAKRSSGRTQRLRSARSLRTSSALFPNTFLMRENPTLPWSLPRNGSPSFESRSFRCDPTFSDTISAGNVIGIELADGQVVRPGNSLPLTVSKGKEQIAVPDIKGTSWTTAKKALMDLGFVIAFKNDSSKAIVATGLGDFATVSSVSPSGSTQVDKGSTVTVGLSIG